MGTTFANRSWRGFRPCRIPAEIIKTSTSEPQPLWRFRISGSARSAVPRSRAGSQESAGTSHFEQTRGLIPRNAAARSASTNDSRFNSLFIEVPLCGNATKMSHFCKLKFGQIKVPLCALPKGSVRFILLLRFVIVHCVQLVHTFSVLSTWENFLSSSVPCEADRYITRWTEWTILSRTPT